MLYQIEITTHCNFQCFYCAGRDMPQRHMDWPLFERILGGLPGGDHVVSLQGEGEPTTHPRFWDMAAAVTARGFTPYTITNGSCAEHERFARQFPYLGVSIDTLDPVEAERIGRYKLERVINNVEALTRLVGAERIRIMTVDYGQPLSGVRAYARARGHAHAVQPLQPKADYARRYPERLTTPPSQGYTYRCRFLERPQRRYYDIEGREYPCCYIKDASHHEPIETLGRKMAARVLPRACTGCREVLTPESLPQAAPAETRRPLLSFITVSKSRLDHLQQTLPHMVAQSGAESVVVDAACPQGSAAWVETHFHDMPAVTAVREADPVFNLSRARNRGAATAAGEWLCFCDADVQPVKEFLEQLTPLLARGRFYRPTPFVPQLFGTMIVHETDFTRVAGYDEVIEGWGGEDRDIYARLELAGVLPASFPAQWLREIPHAADRRSEHYAVKDIRISQSTNALYVQAKLDVMRLLGRALHVPERRDLYRQVCVAVAAGSGGRAPQVEITLPRNSGELPVVARELRLERRIVVRLVPEGGVHG